MSIRNLVLGTLTYTLCTFALAIVWHLVLFEPLYISFGYFEGEPNVALGFLTIVIQGLVLSFLYPKVKISGQGALRGLKFAAMTGLFFWTSHVLAFIAKQEVPNALLFLAMESGYLAFQFGVFGTAIGLIWGSDSLETQTPSYPV